MQASRKSQVCLEAVDLAELDQVAGGQWEGYTGGEWEWYYGGEWEGDYGREVGGGITIDNDYWHQQYGREHPWLHGEDAMRTWDSFPDQGGEGLEQGGHAIV